MNRVGHPPLLAHLPESVLLARSLAGRSLSGANCRGGPPLVLQFVDTFDVDHIFSLPSAIESVLAERGLNRPTLSHRVRWLTPRSLLLFGRVRASTRLDAALNIQDANHRLVAVGTPFGVAASSLDAALDLQAA